MSNSVDFFQSLSLAEIQKKTREYVLGTYGYPMGIALSFGQGEYVYDTEGKQYLDFLCGISVTSLGHGDADIVEAIRDQAERLVHSSNLFYNQEAALLCEALINYSFPGKVFLTNSGTEASEAAFKLARSYGQQARGGASVILTHENSFHGRSTAGMCMTGQDKIHGGFGPLIGDISYITRNDIDILEKEISDRGNDICAFVLELIQGEGGIQVMDQEYVQNARELCKENDILFIVDEIQTGMGRTGKLFAYEHYQITPDVMTLAKALGNGFPIGATIIAEEFTQYLGAGQHGSTFGGNHLATRVAFETLKALMTRDILANVTALSEYFMRRLKVWEGQFPIVRETRGLGLHLGMELEHSGPEVVTAARERGLLLNCTAGQTIRIMPPLNISLERAAEGLDILEGVLKDIK